MGIVRSISFFGIVCIVYLLGLFANLKSPDWDGWLGFFGSILGSIIAILGVYWQVSVQAKKSKEDAEKQQNLLREQLDNEKENQYRQARPFFLVSQEEINYGKEYEGSMYRKVMVKGEDPVDAMMLDDLSLGFHLYVSDKANSFSVQVPQHYLIINNVSTKNMYAVKVLVNYDTQSQDQSTGKCSSPFKDMFKYFVDPSEENLKFYDKKGEEILPENDPKKALKSLNNSYDNAISINKIAAGQEVNLCFTDKNIHEVWVWYTTEIRESIKLYFSTDGETTRELKYKKEDHLLENQLERKNKAGYDSNYTLQDFNQSKRL
ncbi:hypothetical protein [Lactiplantibacillus plantarum]|uniref:hypothetical protein n=1 Tax=Lactiplantibacillus plantarum TaxID=1590 RepID=UPI003F537526